MLVSELLGFIQQHPLLVGGLSLALLLLLMNEWERWRTPAIRLAPQKLVELMNQRAVVIADVRDIKDFNRGHLPHAQSVPMALLSQTDLPALLKQDQNKSVVLICQTGITAQVAARQLHDKGYKEIFLLEGGISSWQNSGLPLILEED